MAKYIDEDWHKKQAKLAEVHWEKTLYAMGSENVRRALLISEEHDKVILALPYKAIYSPTNKEWEFHPTTSFVIDWLAMQLRNMEKHDRLVSKRTVRLQYIALGVSICGTIAVLANVVRLFIE